MPNRVGRLFPIAAAVAALALLLPRLTAAADRPAVRFAPDGKVFVAEKSGIIKEYNSVSATPYFFPRGLDEVAIYPTALSATRVQAHYNVGSGH